MARRAIFIYRFSTPAMITTEQSLITLTQIGERVQMHEYSEQWKTMNGVSIRPSHNDIVQGWSSFGIPWVIVSRHRLAHNAAIPLSSDPISSWASGASRETMGIGTGMVGAPMEDKIAFSSAAVLKGHFFSVSRFFTASLHSLSAKAWVVGWSSSRFWACISRSSRRRVRSRRTKYGFLSRSVRVPIKRVRYARLRAAQLLNLTMHWETTRPSLVVLEPLDRCKRKKSVLVTLAPSEFKAFATLMVRSALVSFWLTSIPSTRKLFLRPYCSRSSMLLDNESWDSASLDDSRTLRRTTSTTLMFNAEIWSFFSFTVDLSSSMVTLRLAVVDCRSDICLFLDSTEVRRSYCVFYCL